MAKVVIGAGHSSRRSDLRRLLSDRGYQVTLAPSCKRAHEEAERDRDGITAFVLDSALVAKAVKDKNPDFVRQLRREAPSVPVLIYMSGDLSEISERTRTVFRDSSAIVSSGNPNDVLIELRRSAGQFWSTPTHD